MPLPFRLSLLLQINHFNWIPYYDFKLLHTYSDSKWVQLRCTYRQLWYVKSFILLYRNITSTYTLTHTHVSFVHAIIIIVIIHSQNWWISHRFIEMYLNRKLIFLKSFILLCRNITPTYALLKSVHLTNS